MHQDMTKLIRSGGGDALEALPKSTPTDALSGPLSTTPCLQPCRDQEKERCSHSVALYVASPLTKTAAPSNGRYPLARKLCTGSIVVRSSRAVVQAIGHFAVSSPFSRNCLRNTWILLSLQFVL